MEVRPTAPNAALGVARKDLLAEARAPDGLSLAVLVGALVLLLFRVAAEGTPLPVGTALWVALLFSATAGLSRTFHAEAERGTLDLPLASPASPAALFAGKMLSGLVVTLACGLVMVAMAAAFFGGGVLREPLPVVAFVVLGGVGLAAQASFLSALSARSPTRAALFPVLMIPLCTPLLAWAARGTVAASLGAGFGDPALAFDLLAVALYDAAFVPLNAILVPLALRA